MMIFPLSVPGRIVLVLIAIVLGLIFSMLTWPDFWKKHLGKHMPNIPSPPVKQQDTQHGTKPK